MNKAATTCQVLWGLNECKVTSIMSAMDILKCNFSFYFVFLFKTWLPGGIWRPLFRESSSNQCQAAQAKGQVEITHWICSSLRSWVCSKLILCQGAVATESWPEFQWQFPWVWGLQRVWGLQNCPRMTRCYHSQCLLQDGCGLRTYTGC